MQSGIVNKTKHVHKYHAIIFFQTLFYSKMLEKLQSLQRHQGFMKYFKNASWLFGEKILRLIVGLFVGIWVARYLGPEQFGLFSYAQSFVGLFAAVATLGLDGIVIRELVKDPSRRDELIGTSFYLKLIGGFAVLLFLAIATNFTSNDTYTNTLIFIIASTTVFQAFNVVDFYFQSQVLSKYIVYANILSLFLSSIVKIFFILYEAPLVAFAWTIVFDTIILSLGFVYFYFKRSTFRIQNLTFKKEIAVALLKDSWPLILSGIVISIYMKIDQIMIMEMMNSTAVGQYAAAVRISEAWYFIPSIIASSFFPAIINAKKSSSEFYHARLQKLYDLMVWLTIAIAIPMTFLSDWIIHLLYGNAYNQAGNVLVLHIWTGLFVAFNIVSGNWYVNENHTKLAFYRNALGALANILLNYQLIPRYGITGAALGTLLSYILASYVYDAFNPKTRIVFIQKTKSLFFRIL